MWSSFLCQMSKTLYAAPYVESLNQRRMATDRSFLVVVVVVIVKWLLMWFSWRQRQKPSWRPPRKAAPECCPRSRNVPATSDWNILHWPRPLLSLTVCLSVSLYVCMCLCVCTVLWYKFSRELRKTAILRIYGDYFSIIILCVVTDCSYNVISDGVLYATHLLTYYSYLK